MDSSNGLLNHLYGFDSHWVYDMIFLIYIKKICYDDVYAHSYDTLYIFIVNDKKTQRSLAYGLFKNMYSIIWL